MARGWESKAIESQQAEVEERRRAEVSRPLSDADRKRQARRHALASCRTRVLQDLQAACHPNHRAMLEQSLAFIDCEIEALDRTP